MKGFVHDEHFVYSHAAPVSEVVAFGTSHRLVEVDLRQVVIDHSGELFGYAVFEGTFR